MIMARNTSHVTVFSTSPLDMESKERLLDRCQPLDLKGASGATTVWKLPVLEEHEESNRLVQNAIADLQYAQVSGNVCQMYEAWSALGLIRLHTRRNPAGALEIHKLALQLISNGDFMKKAITLSDIGLCYERLKRTKEAVSAYEEAIDLMKQDTCSPIYHPTMISLERTMARLSRT